MESWVFFCIWSYQRQITLYKKDVINLNSEIVNKTLLYKLFFVAETLPYVLEKARIFLDKKKQFFIPLILNARHFTCMSDIHVLIQMIRNWEISEIFKEIMNWIAKMGKPYQLEKLILLLYTNGKKNILSWMFILDIYLEFLQAKKIEINFHSGRTRHIGDVQLILRTACLFVVNKKEKFLV